ncbi:hypothetical protein JCM10207_007811 [Rhodosporidiobolus poonsookiae]
MRLRTTGSTEAKGAKEENPIDRQELAPAPQGRRPLFLRLRASTGFIALAVGFSVLVDLSSYSLAVPVIPFRLEQLGYEDVGGLTGWLVAAYAGGLIVSSPPAAWIGARFKNRQIPLTLGLLFMAGAIVMMMLANSFALMCVARILQGFSGTVLWTIGLALVTDSAPEVRVGIVLGQVMMGFSVGQAIGPPVGGTLYHRLGYKAPFVFSLVLVGVDMLLRLLLIEKHVARGYIERGHMIEGFEAPGWGEDAKEEGEETVVAGEGKGEGMRDGPLPLAENTPHEGAKVQARKAAVAEEAAPAVEEKRWLPEEIIGFYIMTTSPRALTNLFLTFINGFIVGGLFDAAMTIYLETEYALSSLGAGLVFLGVVAPTFVASPLSGWLSDKYGTKWPMFLGVLISIPAYPLLIIRGPLALFVFFLVLIGIGVAFFLTPVTVDLSICAADTPMLQTAHVFGIFNLAFSLGSLVGPILAGQVVKAVQIHRAWIILAALSAGLTAVALPGVVLYVGGRLRRRRDGVEQSGEGEA